MNERAILLIALRIGIILLVCSVLYDASFLFTILMNWQEGTDKSVYTVNAIAITIILVLSIGFWLFPSIVLGPYMAEKGKEEIKEVDSSKLFAGFLSLLGIYFLVQSGSKLIAAFSLMILFARDDGYPIYSELIEDFATGLFVLIAGLILLIGRAPITRVVTKLRNL